MTVCPQSVSFTRGARRLRHREYAYWDLVVHDNLRKPLRPIVTIHATQLSTSGKHSEIIGIPVIISDIIDCWAAAKDCSFETAITVGMTNETSHSLWYFWHDLAFFRKLVREKIVTYKENQSIKNVLATW